MGLFGSSKKTETNATVGKVTVYWQFRGTFFESMGSICAPLSITAILSHLDIISGRDPQFTEKILKYMMTYGVCPVNRKDLPDPKDMTALAKFVKNNSAKSKTPASFNCIFNDTAQYLYVIEYGTPSPAVAISQSAAKEMRSVIFARSPLDSKYETLAQEIIRIIKAKPSLDDNRAELRAIGQQINDFDKMVLIARRAEKIGSDEGVQDFSIRLLEYAWDGIAGFMA